MTRLFILCVSFLSFVSAAPEYQFSFGRITGVDELAEDTQRPYNAYYGIPFAQPPVASLRFRAPQPFVNRNNPDRIISSNGFRVSCAQIIAKQDETGEDCLYLNVFTPATANSGGSLKKVMVWVHGGGYILGGALEYIPSRMVTDHDVIVVTVQYRLGLFGFLNPGNGQETNFGLRDQIMAIKWVKDNILQFGGDGNDITIFGESAGSTSVSLLSLSPMSRGLFTKVIMQSGVALTPFATNKRSQEQFLKVAKAWDVSPGCSSFPSSDVYMVYRQYICKNQYKHMENPEKYPPHKAGLTLSWDQYIEEIVECLRRKSVLELIYPPYRTTPVPETKQEQDLGERYTGTLDDVSSPSVDGVVIPRSPESLLADRAYLQANGVLDRSYFVGFNNNEGLIAFDSFLPLLEGKEVSIDYTPFSKPKQAESFVKAVAKFLSPSFVTDDVMDFVVYEYTYPRGDGGKTDVMNALKVYTDVWFGISTVQFARALTTISETTPVYMYLFDHYPELKDPNSPVWGSNHGLELSYEFDRNSLIETLGTFYAKLHTPSDRPLYNIMRNTITQFAKTGVPSSQEYSSLPRFRPDDEYYLAIATNPEVRQRVYAKRMALWTEILPKKERQSLRPRSPKFY